MTMQCTHLNSKNASDVLNALIHGLLHIALRKRGKVDVIRFLFPFDRNVECVNVHFLFGWGGIYWIVSYCVLQLGRVSYDTHLGHPHPLTRPHRSNHHRRRSIRSRKTWQETQTG